MSEQTPSVLEQLLELYVIPAIRLRQESGELATPFELSKAQVIFHADERHIVVRLNEEVQALAKVVLRSGVSKSPGEVLFDDEVEGYEEVRLAETEDPDCGHATMLRVRGRWLVAFDFRYNRGKAKVCLERAREFFLLAEGARTRDAWASLIYVLFAAAELAARAELLLIPDERYQRSKTHKATMVKFNASARLGNVSADHTNALNRLAKLRPKVYSTKPVVIDPSEGDALLRVVRDMIDWAAKRSG